jgi:hypothetical protein
MGSGFAYCGCLEGEKVWRAYEGGVFWHGFRGFGELRANCNRRKVLAVQIFRMTQGGKVRDDMFLIEWRQEQWSGVVIVHYEVIAHTGLLRV